MDLINKHFAQQINFIIIVLAASACCRTPGTAGGADPGSLENTGEESYRTPSRGVHTAAGIADDLTWILELAA